MADINTESGNYPTHKTIFSGRTENPLDGLSSLGTFFTGADPTSFAGIELDPYTPGHAFIYWVRLPEWFERDDDLKHFKTLTEKMVVSVNGITDIELQEGSQQYGFAANDVSFVTGITRGNTDFTIGFREFSGTPLTKCISKWINLVRDSNTGISLYPKKFNCEYSARNHTGVLLYIVTRPDATNVSKDNIEKAILWANVFPTNIPNSSLFNYELGSTDIVTSVDINFKGVPLFGNAVDQYAKRILTDYVINTDDDDDYSKHIFLDSITEAGDPGTAKFNNGILKDIYNPDNGEN